MGAIFLAAIQRLLLACAVLTLLVIAPPAWAGLTWYNGVSLSRADYDYAPAVMFGDGPYIKMWWCGGTSSGDGINYAELTGTGWTAPQLVLEKSTNGWDSYHVCDPSVIKGSFSYAGTTYAYALYYTGTYDAIGYDSHIGVAFSNDGKTWVKNTANPVVSPGANSLSQYGAGMQTVYRNTSTGLITMAYLDSSIPGSGGAHLFMVTSTDGKTFSDPTALPAPLPGGHGVATGDIAWDGSTGTWLVMTKDNNDTEIFIYRTANGELTSTWNTVGGISSTITGKVKNHNPGWLRLSNGDIYSEANTKSKYIYFGVGDGGDDGPSTWDIGQAEWVDSPVWVDFAFGGSPNHGTFANPFATLADGVSHVSSGGDIFLKGPQSGPGTITITKPMTLQAVGGSVTIGAP